MKPSDIKSNYYAKHKVRSNEKNPKFIVSGRARISTNEKTFANAYTPNWSEQAFVISKIKNTVPWTYVINDLNGEGIFGTFNEKQLENTNQKNLE